MCRVLKVSRAGYYAWSKRPASQHTQEDQRLGLQVAAIYRESRGRYGSPRVHAELRERGQRTGRKRVARLMQTAGLRAREPRRFRCTTDSRHGMAIKQNLLERRFYRARTQPRLGHGHYVCVDPGGLVVLGGNHRSVLAPRGRLVAE